MAKSNKAGASKKRSGRSKHSASLQKAHKAAGKTRAGTSEAQVPPFAGAGREKQIKPIEQDVGPDLSAHPELTENGMTSDEPARNVQFPQAAPGAMSDPGAQAAQVKVERGNQHYDRENIQTPRKVQNLAPAEGDQRALPEADQK